MTRHAAMLLGLTLCSCVTTKGAGSPRSTAAAVATEDFPVPWHEDRESAGRTQFVPLTRTTLADRVDPFTPCEAADEPAPCIAYLHQWPQGSRRAAAIDTAIALTMTQAEDERLVSFEKIVALEPGALQRLPTRVRLTLTGPPGLQVRDLVAMGEGGLSEEVLASRIAHGHHEYAEFTLAELEELKAMGVPDQLVQAMMTSHERAVSERKQAAERDRVRKEIAELRALVERQQRSGGGAGHVVQTKEGPMDAAACMAKRLAAVKLCEQIPWPGSTACLVGAEQGFPCK